MGKHKVRLFYAFAFLIPVFLIAFLGYKIVTLPDKFWNDILFRPVFGRNFPLLGFIITFAFVYLTGLLLETSRGRRLIMVLFGYIPLFGKLITLQGNVSSAIHTMKAGCICAPFAADQPFRSAVITAVLKTKDSYLVTAAFLGGIPDIRHLEPSVMVKAREVKVNGQTHYRFYPLAIGLQLELGAGITLADDALRDWVKVPLYKVLIDEGYIKE